jgi:ribonucleoside-diphosphate reductase beta chain
MSSNGLTSKNLSYFPIIHHNLENFVKSQENVIWSASDIRSEDDRKDWSCIKQDIKDYVKFILAFFAQIDGIINVNLIDYFKKETSFIKEATHFYTVQAYIEMVHNKTYSLMIETFISDPTEKDKILNAVLHYPIITEISNWVEVWMNTNIPLLQRVIAFVCVEGIIFCSSFAFIYWLKSKNILNSLCLANSYIARDEAIHAEFGIELYFTILNMHMPEFTAVPVNIIHSIIKSACDISEKFTKIALREDLSGLTQQDLISYIRCTGDYIANKFQCDKIYNEENKCAWMRIISITNKTNFFERRVTEYTVELDKCEIANDCEF